MGSSFHAKIGSRWKWILYLALLAALAASVRFLRLEKFSEQVLAWVRQLGAWGPAIFIAIYLVATVLLIPGSALTIGAGALFGVAEGSLYVSIGATLGATAAFLISRYLARDAIARKVESNERFAAIDRAVAHEGWKIVGLTRLSPVFPFTFLNYAFGLTRVSLRDYVFASWIGIMPGTVFYAYIGSAAQSALKQNGRRPAEWGFYTLGFLAALIVTALVTRAARKALRRQIESPD